MPVLDSMPPAAARTRVRESTPPAAAAAPSTLDKDTEVFIDVFRGLAALGVLVTHACDLGFRSALGSDLTGAPAVWQWAAATLGHGSFLVWGFFLVSGLCIHLSISRSATEPPFPWRRYLAARITRIYPLLLLGLALAVVVWWFTDHLPGAAPLPWRQLVASLFSLQILTNTFPAFDPSWSLSNEVIYYIVWPLVLVSFPRRLDAAFRFALVASLGSAAVIGVCWKVLHRLEASTVMNGLWSVSILFPVWLCGAWLAGNWRRAAACITPRRWMWAVVLCLVSEIILAIVKHTEPPQSAIDLVGLTSIPGLVLLMAGARHARLAAYPRLKPLARWLGQFSYPCYVLHMPLLAALHHWLIPRLPAQGTGSPLLVSLMLLLPVVAVLAVVGPWLERRAMNWRAAFLERLRA